MYHNSQVRALHLTLEPPLLPERLELRTRFLERHQLALSLCAGVVAVANVDGAGVTFLGADDCHTRVSETQSVLDGN